jgi:hypothetical protein
MIPKTAGKNIDKNLFILSKILKAESPKGKR